MRAHRTWHIAVFTAMIYYSEKTQNKIRGEKAPGVKPRGNQARAFKGPLPVESHGTHLIPPIRSCDNTREEFAQGAIGDPPSSYGFQLGPVTEGTLS